MEEKNVKRVLQQHNIFVNTSLDWKCATTKNTIRLQQQTLSILEFKKCCVEVY